MQATKAKTHNNGRMIRVTKHDSSGKVIAAAEVSTLEAAHRFLDSLNDDGTVKPSGKPSMPIPAQPQQASGGAGACVVCGGLQWVKGTDTRPMPCRACHGSGKATSARVQA